MSDNQNYYENTNNTDISNNTENANCINNNDNSNIVNNRSAINNSNNINSNNSNDQCYYSNYDENQSLSYVDRKVNNGNGNQSFNFVSSSANFRNEAKQHKRKSREKKPRQNIFQLVLIAVVSSMIGGGSVFAAMMMIPSATDSIASIAQDSGLKTTEVKKVTINESTSSPAEAIAEKVSPSVVGIVATVGQQQNSFFFSSEASASEGSGIILSKDGYILTNNHVVEGALVSGTNNLSNGSKIEVVLPDDSNTTYPATLIGRDSESDLAVLKINANNLQAAEIGDSSNLKIGELAVAIGNPGGLQYQNSVTTGIISGLNRTLTISDGTQMTLIQTDAAINPGNSGGPLCNSTGEVIGINTVKIAASGYEGIGFAIPINDAKAIADDLIEFKYVKGRPLLGVSIDNRYTDEMAQRYNMPKGLLVGSVTEGGPAENAGIKIGDIITKFDGKEVTTFDELNKLKDAHKPGDTVEIEVYREKGSVTLKVTLGEQTI